MTTPRPKFVLILTFADNEQAMVVKKGKYGERGDRVHVQQEEEQRGEHGLPVHRGCHEVQEGECWKRWSRSST